MLHHLVLMKFKPDVTDEMIEDLERHMNDLPNSITEIQVYEFGRDIVRSERSYDFGLVSVFANMESLKRYQVHPDHQAVLGKLKAMCENIVAVDFEASGFDAVKETLPKPPFSF